MADTNIDDLPWDQIKEISEKGLFEEVFKNIPKERFQFAAQENNRDALIESALKSLKKKDPEASYENAAVLADLMQKFAQEMLKG